MKTQMLSILGLLVILSACAQQEEPAMVAAEPVYDKLGNLVLNATAAAEVVMIDTDDDGVPDTPVTPEPDDNGQNQNQNQNQNG